MIKSACSGSVPKFHWYFAVVSSYENSIGNYVSENNGYDYLNLSGMQYTTKALRHESHRADLD